MELRAKVHAWRIGRDPGALCSSVPAWSLMRVMESMQLKSEPFANAMSCLNLDRSPNHKSRGGM